MKSKEYEFTLATAEDNEAIKNLFEHTNYKSVLDLQFRRGTDPFASFMQEDAGAVVMLLKHKITKDIIAMGACSFHEVYINGEIKRGAYLNGLKILPEYQQILSMMPLAFQTIQEATQSRTDLYYATILQPAKNLQQIFEKKRRNMPIYQKQCLNTAFIISPAHSTKGLHLEKGNVDGLDDFYEKHLINYNLAPVNRKMHGVCDEDFITWRENGTIIAACAVLNNQSTKNYFLNSYNGILKPLSHFPTRLLGLPAPPKTGESVNNASLSLLLFDESVDIPSRARFMKAASSFAREYDMIMIGLNDTDPTYHAFDKMIHLKYNSYLYTVNWGEVQNINNRPIYLDVAYI
ncbi:MAG: hypothetical protein RR139_08875 [Lachnospiraceae bacterium]